jgi:hypothetical protein
VLRAPDVARQGRGRRFARQYESGAIPSLRRQRQEQVELAEPGAAHDIEAAARIASVNPRRPSMDGPHVLRLDGDDVDDAQERSAP